MEAGKDKMPQEHIVGVAVYNIFKKYDENRNNFIDFE
jgi:hypothetical protein